MSWTTSEFRQLWLYCRQGYVSLVGRRQKAEGKGEPTITNNFTDCVVTELEVCHRTDDILLIRIATRNLRLQLPRA